MGLIGMRKCGRPKRNFLDAAREDMAGAEVVGEDVENPLWTREAERRRSRTEMESKCTNVDPCHDVRIRTSSRASSTEGCNGVSASSRNSCWLVIVLLVGRHI